MKPRKGARRVTKRVTARGAAKQPAPGVPVPAEKVARPAISVTPDWSPETMAAFDGMTALERAWVEWYTVGLNAAEAYRLAVGTDPDPDYSKQYGYLISQRPRVKAAVAAALKDRNVGARSDREWKLAELRDAIAICAKDKCPKAQAARGKLVMQMAQLQGEIIRRSEVVVSEEETPAMKRFRLAIEKARELARGRVAVRDVPDAAPLPVTA